METRIRVGLLALLALIVVVLCASYVLAALSSPDFFGVFLSDTPLPAARSLESKLEAMGEVRDVAYLREEPALAEFTRELMMDPDYDFPDITGPHLDHALVVELAHPWNLLATRRVVTAIQAEQGLHVNMREVLPWWLGSSEQ